MQDMEKEKQLLKTEPALGCLSPPTTHSKTFYHSGSTVI